MMRLPSGVSDGISRSLDRLVEPSHPPRGIPSGKILRRLAAATGQPRETDTGAVQSARATGGPPRKLHGFPEWR
jgi:hypothetical protein